MSELAMLERSDTGFRPTQPGTVPVEQPVQRSATPRVSSFDPIMTTYLEIAGGVAAVGIATICAAGIFAVGRDNFRAADDRTAHYKSIREFLVPSGPTWAVAGRAMNEAPYYERSIQPSWERLSETTGWIVEASTRIKRLAAKVDGWKGVGSTAATGGTVNDAFALLEKLQIEAPRSAPKISLDDEGEFIFFWKRDGLLASIQLGGDKTYTFFGNRGAGDVIIESVALAEPMPTEVTDILNSQV